MSVIDNRGALVDDFNRIRVPLFDGRVSRCCRRWAGDASIAAPNIPGSGSEAMNICVKEPAYRTRAQQCPPMAPLAKTAMEGRQIRVE
jgi:hypothetical protein